MEITRTILCGPHYVRTTVTAKPSVVRKWVRKIWYLLRRRGRLVVGLGVQWVPGYIGAATLQLCVENSCLIFQIVHSGHCPAILRRFLVDPDVIFVGVWNHRDAEMLMESQHKLEVGPLVDLRNVASDFRGFSRSLSMGTLAAKVLGLDGMEKDPSVGMSYWNDYYLSAVQVNYACYDAFLAFLMAKELRVWNWVDQEPEPEPDSDSDSDWSQSEYVY